MKFLAMHITNQKLSFDIFTVGNVLNIFMEHDLTISNDFWHKRKMYNFDPYNVLLTIATNIPVLLMTASVLQGHIYKYINICRIIYKYYIKDYKNIIYVHICTYLHSKMSVKIKMRYYILH